MSGVSHVLQYVTQQVAFSLGEWMKLPLLAYVYLSTSFFPVISGFLKRKYIEKEGRLFFLAVSLGLIFTLVQYYLTKQGTNNLWLFHLYRLIWQGACTFVFIAWTPNETIRIVMKWSMGIYASVWIIAKLSFEPLNQWDNYTSTISNILLITMAMYLFYELGRSSTTSMLSGFRFWVLLGVIILAVGHLLLFAIGDKLVQLSIIDFMSLYSIHWIVNTLANLCFSYGFWVLPQTTKLRVEN